MRALSPRSRASGESVPYDVIERDGDFELRSYPALSVVRSRESADGDGSAFRKLFRFISRENSAQKKIAMTTPVLIERDRDDDMVMDFIMPPGEPVPQPLERGVEVTSRPAVKLVALRFGGFGTRKGEQRAMERLREMVAARRLKASGEPIVAYYDAPTVPPPFRRNEVMVAVQ